MEQYIEPYLSWILEKLQELTAIDSPSGYTHRVSAYLMEEYWKMGYEPVSTQKGGVLVTLGGGKAKEVQDQSEPSRQEGAIRRLPMWIPWEPSLRKSKSMEDFAFHRSAP